jgi:hypothetical protein
MRGVVVVAVEAVGLAFLMLPLCKILSLSLRGVSVSFSLARISRARVWVEETLNWSL